MPVAGKNGKMRGIRLNKTLKKIVNNSYFIFSLRIMLGAIFIYAAYEKISSPSEFAQVIRNYRIIPDSLSNLIAVVLPWLEFYCGLFLIVGIFIRGSSLLLSGILFVFLLALISAQVRGLNIDCGCFGAGETVGWGKVVEDFFLLLTSLTIFIIRNDFFSLDSKIKRKKIL